MCLKNSTALAERVKRVELVSVYPLAGLWSRRTMEESGLSGGTRMEPPSHSRCQPGNGRIANQDGPNSARVLVIDDEQGIRRFLRSSLATQGYEIFEASTGREGLQSVPVVRPDLIILDFGLPDLDGVDVTRSLREWTQTPILFLSVREQEADKIAALDAGADDYLTKPFGVGELLAR